MGERLRNFLFTDFNIDENQQALWLEHDWIHYCVFQLEEAPTTKKLHLQGYVELKERRMLSVLQIAFGNCHMEARRGKQKQAIAYCTKLETRQGGPWSVGIARMQGSNPILNDVRAEIDLGICELDIAKNYDFQLWCQYRKAFREYRDLSNWYMRPQGDLKTVIWIWGPSRTGKSFKARRLCEEFESVYIKNGMADWFDTYAGEQTVILDDFTGQIDRGKLMAILDNYPSEVEKKGGTVPFDPLVIIITSNRHPTEYYPESNYIEKKALTNRITAIEHRVSTYVDRSAQKGNTSLLDICSQSDLDDSDEEMDMLEELIGEVPLPQLSLRSNCSPPYEGV